MAIWGTARHRRAARLPLLGVLALSVGLAACSATTPEAGRATLRLEWNHVPLFDLIPSAVAVAGGAVAVAGTTRDGRAPALDRILGGVTAEVELRPAEPYARSARLTAVAGDGSTLYLIGSRTGGAHGNPRWTVWDGPAHGPVTSRPQGFFTFGGQDAGPLLATVIVDGRPILVGSRGGAHGADAALYTRTGTTWAAMHVDAALRSGPTRVLGFGAVAAHGSRLLIAGDAVDTSNGVHQSPVVFVGSLDGPWQSVTLPVPPAESEGHLSRATSVSCDAAQDVCWVAGWSGGHPMVWAIAVTDEPTSVVLEAHSLVGDEPAGTDPVAIVTTTDDVPVVLTNAAVPQTVIGCPGEWRTAAAPADATAAAALGRTLFAVTGQPARISVARVPAC